MGKGVKLDALPKVALLYIKHTAVLWLDFAGLRVCTLKAKNYCLL